MKRKKIIILCISIAIIIAGSYGLAKIFIFNSGDADAKTDADWINSYDVKILVYGEDFPHNKAIEYSMISDLTEKSYAYDNNYVFLLINDLNGEYSIDEDKAAELVNYADKNPNFNFYYVGENSLKIFYDMFPNGTALEDEDRTWGYSFYDGFRIPSKGIYTTNEIAYKDMNEYLFAECIFGEFASIIRSNEVYND